MTAAVLVVGSVNADLTVWAHRRPVPGETLTGDAFEVGLGGKGANQAVAVARAGASALMVGCIGDDAFGALVAERLDAAGVDVTHVRTVAGPTGVAHIRVDAEGENDIVVVPLANAALESGAIAAAVADARGRAGALLTRLETPSTLTLEALRLAREAGIVTVLDPAPARELEDAVWPLVDVVTPNETEARILTGLDASTGEGAIAAGQWFVDRGVGAAVVTMAGAGSVLVTADGASHHAPIPVEVVDTTAAGDAFAGHLAAALADGAPLADAIGRASAAGAIAVTRRGASASLPTAAEVDALLAR